MAKTKKVIIIILVVFIVLISISLLTFYIDVERLLHGDRPIFVIQTDEYTDRGGTVIVCYGFGYQMVWDQDYPDDDFLRGGTCIHLFGMHIHFDYF